MKYGGTLLIVKDIVRTREFYETVMEQKVLMDLGEHVSLENGLGLQTNYGAVIGQELEMNTGGNNIQLYFEVDHLDEWGQKLKQVEGLKFLHDIKEYPWGQRTVRFYDFDQNIVEVAESMERVIKRLLKQGVSVEETSKRTMYPVEFIQSLV